MSETELEERLCKECGDKLHGRADKKFCDDLCRNAYYNRVNRGQIQMVRNVNRILSKNRSILAELNPDEKGRTHKNTLVRLGFNFTYHTHTYTTKAGATYFFCYDKGYLPIENDWYLLVTNKDR